MQNMDFNSYQKQYKKSSSERNSNNQLNDSYESAPAGGSSENSQKQQKKNHNIASIEVKRPPVAQLEVIEEEKDAPEEAKRIRNIRKKINATNDAN